MRFSNPAQPPPLTARKTKPDASYSAGLPRRRYTAEREGVQPNDRRARRALSSSSASEAGTMIPGLLSFRQEFLRTGINKRDGLAPGQADHELKLQTVKERIP